MPTERFGKVRRMLKNSLAHVVRRIPFTIQLDYDTTDFTQPITLGIDAGNKHMVFLPILNWTNEDVEEFVTERGIECHPLYYRGGENLMSSAV